MALIFPSRASRNYATTTIIIINRGPPLNKFDIYKEGINKAYEFDRQISIRGLDTTPLS